MRHPVRVVLHVSHLSFQPFHVAISKVLQVMLFIIIILWVSVTLFQYCVACQNFTSPGWDASPSQITPHPSPHQFCQFAMTISMTFIHSWVHGEIYSENKVSCPAENAKHIICEFLDCVVLFIMSKQFSPNNLTSVSV